MILSVKIGSGPSLSVPSVSFIMGRNKIPQMMLREVRPARMMNVGVKPRLDMVTPVKVKSHLYMIGYSKLKTRFDCNYI